MVQQMHQGISVPQTHCSGYMFQELQQFIIDMQNGDCILIVQTSQSEVGLLNRCRCTSHMQNDMT